MCLIYGFDLCDFVIDVAGENRERKRGWRKHRERERERERERPRPVLEPMGKERARPVLEPTVDEGCCCDSVRDVGDG